MSDWAPLARPSVADEELDGELVLYDADRRRLLVLNESASAIWRGCDGSQTVAALVEKLAGALGGQNGQNGQISDDVNAFLRDLRAAGLVN